jgi:hypothetical protein
MNMGFGTWNGRSVCRSASLKTIAREIGKHKLDLVGVQEVVWDEGGTERAEDYVVSRNTIFMIGAKMVAKHMFSFKN